MTKAVTLSDGSEVSLPLVTDDAFACFELFKAEVGSLPELPSVLEYLSVRGTTACVLLVVDYRQMSIGPYREMVVMSPVKYMGVAGAPVKRGVFVHEIAVTSEISMITGKEVWGFPKYIADIRIIESFWNVRATMESAKSAFTLSLPHWGFPVPAIAPLPVFSVKDAKLLLSYIKMKGIFFIAPPAAARASLTGATSSLSFLGESARAAIAGFMKVKKATLDEPAFVEML